MPTPQDLQALNDLIVGARGTYSTLGWLGALSTLAYGLVRVYRLPFLQALLPRIARWGSLKSWVRMLIVFALSFAGTALAALAAGTPFGVAAASAIVPAVAAGVGALAIRQGEKAIAPKLAGMGIDPKKASLIPPIDLDRVP